jgi:Flp pilus assembly protein TadD
MRPKSAFGLLAIAAGLASLLTACSTTSGPTPLAYATGGVSTSEFERGANRPPTAQTLFGLARLLAAQGRDDEAEPILRRILDEHPRFVPAYSELAELHLRHQRIGDAIGILQSGLNIAPKSPMLLNNLGLCWLLREDHERALHYFTLAAAQEPNNARFRSNMATALGKQGRYDEALAVYLQVVSRRDAHHNVGVLAETRGDHDRAAVEFVMAKKHAP